MNEAIVFLTHLREPRILRHFERLKLESGLDTFLHYDEPSTRWRCPPRHAQLEKTSRAIDLGYTDLAFIPPMVALVDRYEFLWHVEYDVDFAGHWGDFFARTRGRNVDLLSTTIQSRAENPRWRHWRWAKGPSDFPERLHLKTFHPIMRCSKRMLKAYVHELFSGEWEGHTESLLPSIAAYRGFSIEDLGRGEVYTNSALDPHLSPGTFVWLPWKTTYYHEAPNDFERGFLHHPIKTDPRFTKRVTSHLLRMAHFARLLP
jgi:hypothetical protein